ncbi:MAG TPA: hypothetical protein VIJ82_30580 [Streptosporangiaceae bacterium]|jgi:hypothetical protein
MRPDPLWLGITYLMDRVRQRARAARSGNPESGALTLEWIVIAFVLVAAAAGTAAWLATKISSLEGKVGG